MRSVFEAPSQSSTAVRLEYYRKFWHIHAFALQISMTASGWYFCIIFVHKYHKFIFILCMVPLLHFLRHVVTHPVLPIFSRPIWTSQLGHSNDRTQIVYGSRYPGIAVDWTRHLEETFGRRTRINSVEYLLSWVYHKHLVVFSFSAFCSTGRSAAG
jgi:hypothetical protein